MAEALTLLAKLAKVRNAVEAVEKMPSDDGDDFTYAPANLVFDVVRDQLRLKKVLALTSSVVPVEPEQGKSRVRLYVVFVDQENPDDKLEVQWIGAGDNAAAAATNALKGAFMSTFLIEAVEPADVSRREARQRRVRRVGIASHAQLRHRIRGPGREKGLYEAELLEMANLMLDPEEQIGALENLPKRLVDPLYERIKSYEKEPAAA